MAAVGLRVDHDRVCADGGGKRNFRDAHAGAGKEQRVARTGLRAAWNDVLASLCGAALVYADGVASVLHMLQHYDGVCACGHWRAGHDLDGLTRGEGGAGPLLARADGAGELQRMACILRTYGIAVAGAAGEWWLVAVCNEGSGEDAVQSLLERNAFGASDGGKMCSNSIERGLAGQQ